MTGDYVEQTLIDLTLQMIEAEFKRDEKSLRLLLHDNLRFRRASGDVDKKEAFLTSLTAEGYENYELRLYGNHVSVEVFEDQAVTSAIVYFRGKRGGEPKQGSFRNTRIWLKEADKGWQCAFWFNTALK